MSVKEALEILRIIRRIYKNLVEVKGDLDELNLDDYHNKIEEILTTFEEEFREFIEGVK